MTEIIINLFKYINILFLGIFVFSIFARIKMNSIEELDESENFLSPLMIGLYSMSSFFLLFIKPTDIYSFSGFDYYSGLSLFLFLLIYYSFRKITSDLLKSNLIFYDMAFILMAVGIPVIYRLDPELGMKQMQFVFIGATAFLILQLVLKLFADKIKIKITLWPFALAAIFILLLTTQFFGSFINGSKNWIRLGGIAIQPSEFIKIIYIYFLACTLDKQLTLRRFLFVGGAVAAICGFFVLQRDLGSAFIFLAVFMCFLLIRDKHFIFFGTTVIFTSVFAFIAFLSFSHIKTRVYSWLDPWKYVSNESYQITQSLFAIASGGLFGRGFTMGDPLAIPAVSTDFIFAAICEELGIITGIMILLVFLGLTFVGFQLAGKISNQKAAGVVIGLTTINAVQTLVIIMGVTNLIPITGVTLPFVSYGGSSLLYQFLNLGILTFLFDRYINNRKERNRDDLIELLEHRFRTKKKIKKPIQGEEL